MWKIVAFATTHLSVEPQTKHEQVSVIISHFCLIFLPSPRENGAKRAKRFASEQDSFFVSALKIHFKRLKFEKKQMLLADLEPTREMALGTALDICGKVVFYVRFICLTGLSRNR